MPPSIAEAGDDQIVQSEGSVHLDTCLRSGTGDARTPVRSGALAILPYPAGQLAPRP